VDELGSELLVVLPAKEEDEACGIEVVEGKLLLLVLLLVLLPAKDEDDASGNEAVEGELLLLVEDEEFTRSVEASSDDPDACAELDAIFFGGRPRLRCGGPFDVIEVSEVVSIGDAASETEDVDEVEGELLPVIVLLVLLSAKDEDEACGIEVVEGELLLLLLLVLVLLLKLLSSNDDAGGDNDTEVVEGELLLL
jgi:hypothetical protein